MSIFLRLIIWIVGTALIGGLALWIMDFILDGFSVGSPFDFFLGAVVIAGITSLTAPFIFRVAASIHPLLFPIVSFPLTTATVWIAGEITNLQIDGWATALWIAIGMTILTSIESALFSLDDDPTYERIVVRSLRKHFGNTPSSPTPGIFFLEIDGLAGPLLEEAMEAGYAPTMRSWIESGSHQLMLWEPDLSCQTSASQAGILLGDNTNIPAFRWWDKQSGQLLASSSMPTARRLEQTLGSDRGLLAPGGASRFNVFSGGADDCVATFAKMSLTKGGSNFYFSYLLSPYMLGRLISRFFQDVLREWWEESQQKLKKVEPRLNRPWKYAFIRAATTSLMVDASRLMLTADILRGVPSCYCTIFAYDEVAHHTGIRSPYTFKVLKNIDRMFSQLETVLENAPRPYQFVILSDHGQSGGWTFKQRFNETLGELVQSLVTDQTRLASMLDSQESVARVDALIEEATESNSRTAGLIRQLFVSLNKQDGATIEPTLEVNPKAGTHGQSQAYVLASGNLGLISFTEWPERMTYEQIVDAYPQLIPGLVNHEGIGIIMVRSEEQGPIVLGRGGSYFLRDDTHERENPIAPFGPLAADHLRRTDSFAACPDILVVSKLWPDTGDVAAFEELIGNHGGLGGLQRKPFVLHPTQLPSPDRPIVGAAALNDLFRGWIQRAQSSTDV
jgi:putative membrane protein